MSTSLVDNPKLTITLTGRPPVKITKEDWPIIASAEDKTWDNQYECQANRAAKWKLIVRQHNDGRTIVYAVHTYTSQWQGEDGRDVRGGEMLTVSGADAESVGDTDPIVAAIQRVAAEIEDRLEDAGQWSTGTFPRLAHECVASLPAEEL
jgi:hypothetical protein